ncbi:MAG: EAL domain-containing protein [Candidatus Limnocylindria bacterium]
MRRERASAASRSVPSPASALHQIADHVVDAVVRMDADGVITGWNAHAETLFGWTAAEVMGRRLADTIIPARDREAHAAGLARYLVDGRGIVLDTHTQVAALHRDGHEISVDLSVTALADASGTTFVVFMRDLSSQRAVEAALRDSEERFKSLVENLPGIAYVDEMGGHGRWVSPRVASILGYTPEEWLGDDELWERALHPDDRERAVAQMVAAETAEGPIVYTYRLFTREGRLVWIRDHASVVRDGTGQPVVQGVMFDVTHERGIEVELELEVAERAAIAAALHRLPAGQEASATASALCRELLRLRHLDIAVVYEFSHGDAVVPLAVVAPPGAPIAVGRPLPMEQARYLRESATGPWVDEWHRTRDDDDYRRAWLDVGLTCGAFVPFGSTGTVHGLISAGTTSLIGAAGVSRWLPSLAEFGAIAAALLVPELAARREEAGARSAVEAIIAERQFSVVYQPIVRLSDASAVGYEALARFDDGTQPDRRFAEAAALGLGSQLELAVMASVLDEARSLPKGPFLSLNLSPGLLADPETTRLLGSAGRRALVLEVTEQSAIDDYDVVRARVGALPSSITLAVDDAGAGFASLRHIIELRPKYVKLDMQLVRGVDADPARQALIAGMVYFAHQSGCLLVAEGIESEAERGTLARLGIPFGQGFLFAQPAPVLAMRALGIGRLGRSTPRVTPARVLGA